MRIPLVIASVLLVTALAGCTDDGPAPAVEPENKADEGLIATKDTGVIRGVVVDAAIVPIAGAVVSVANEGRSATTEEDGSFGFSGLTPGAYFLNVEKDGFFDPGTIQVVVEADVDLPDVVKIILEADPSFGPYAVTIPWTGYFQCGTGVPEAGSLNPCALTGIAQDYDIDLCGDSCSDNTHDFEVDSPVPDYVQLEMVWEGSQLAGTAFSLSIHDPFGLTGTESWIRVAGVSPLVLAVDGAQMQENLNDDSNGTVYSEYTAKVFPSAGEDVPTAFIEQEFEVYATHFYGFLPEEGWTFINDGTPVPPS